MREKQWEMEVYRREKDKQVVIREGVNYKRGGEREVDREEREGGRGRR